MLNLASICCLLALILVQLFGYRAKGLLWDEVVFDFQPK